MVFESETMKEEGAELKKGEKYEAYKYRILSVLKEKPRHPIEIEAKTGIPHSSLMECLQDLKREGWVKQLKDKSYALFTFTSLEGNVRRVLDEWKRKFEGSCCIRPLTLEELMFKVGKNYEDPNARVKVRSVALKLGWTPPEISGRLVEHSRGELRAAVEGWVGHLEPLAGLYGLEGLENLPGLGLLDIYRGEVWMPPPSEPDVANYDLLVQHLESGCPRLLEEWRQIRGEVSRFLSLAGAVARDLLEGVEEEARRLAIPLDRGVGGISGGEPRVFERNCVLLIYRALGGDVVLDPQRNIKVVSGKREDKDFFIVEPGPCAVTDDASKAGEFAEFLRREVASKDNELKMDEVKAERRKLKQKIEEFKGQLRDIMAKIDEGLYLKGWCKKCEWLQQPLGPTA
jgi:hypothetical protein